MIFLAIVDNIQPGKSEANPAVSRIKAVSEVWNDIPQEKQEAFLQYLINFVLDDVRKGVSGEDEIPLFKVIDEIYDEYRPKGCYFCDNTIDGNELEFNPDRNICLECGLKVANLLVACGLSKERIEEIIRLFDPGLLTPNIGTRSVQKTRL